MTFWMWVAGALVVAAAAMGFKARKVRNRIALVPGKISGRLTLSWSDLATLMVLPSKLWADRLVRPMTNALGDEQVLYQTPLGPIWGGPDDVDSLTPVIE